MSLTSLMSGANLDVYAQVALVIFLIAFALILWRTFSPRNAGIHARARMLPLDDDYTAIPNNEESEP